MVYAAAGGQLGPDPGEAIVAETGEWAIRWLCLTLAISPLARLQARQKFLTSFRPMRYRRALGVATWVYALLHFFAYCAFLLAWQWQEVLAELIRRPYISVGFIALLTLTPLALTSNDYMVRRLRAGWRRLHRWVYLAAVLAVVHVVWQVRSDAGEAILYGVLIALLLGWRLWQKRGRASSF